MALLRGMMQSVDPSIEDALDAHGFSFSALAANEEGAVLHFAAGSWHLALNLPPDGRSRVSLRRGSAEAPFLSLILSIGEGACRDLPSALAIAMDLFTTIGQA